jgi:hypothetical protein
VQQKMPRVPATAVRQKENLLYPELWLSLLLNYNMPTGVGVGLLVLPELPVESA